MTVRTILLGKLPRSILLPGIIVVMFAVAALFAPWIAPSDPTNIATFNLADAELPPAFAEAGEWRFPLGTDNQGRDLLSAIIYGTRISLAIGGTAVLISALFGVTLGLVAGYFGGIVDAFIMRLADVILSFPTILLALLVSGIARAIFPDAGSVEYAPIVLVTAIAIHDWVQYARTVRAATMVESRKDYVRAAQVIGLPRSRVLFRHILPNVITPVLVVATISVATAILAEATLSFLGVGMPPTYPSLGTLIRIGYEFMLSGMWWISLLPAVTLVILILALNVVGDWARDHFNPKLRARR